MTKDEIQALMKEIHYRDWRFVIFEGAVGVAMYLQVQFETMYAGARTHHFGRKWQLSKHMTRSELVQTALMAVLAAEEHEARENFFYKGVSVFGPHIDVEKLRDLCMQHPLDVRKAV